MRERSTALGVVLHRDGRENLSTRSFREVAKEKSSMPFVTVPDGTRLYYEESGTGEPLVLISGLGWDHRFWNGVREEFARRYHVIVYDHRGTGQSDGPGILPSSTRRFAQDVVALLDHLGIARAHIYGHSMGGMIGQWLGIEHAKRLGALVLGATSPGKAYGVPRPAEVDVLFTHLPRDPQEARATLTELGFSPDWITLHLPFVEQFLQVMQHVPRETLKFQYQALQEHDTCDLLSTISAPTLIIHGRQDLIIPTANAPLLTERIPGSQLFLVNSKRHGYFVDAGEEANRVVYEFLARHSL
jgi:3-oxoadipate enol-lactonase